MGQTGNAYDFLRLLHDIDIDKQGLPNNGCFRLLDEASVTERLLWFACLAGNDYAKFDGVGTARAVDIALRCRSPTPKVPHTIVREMAKAVASITTLAPTDFDIDEAESSIKNASDMFRHGLAFDPMAGEHRHLSGQAPSSRLSLLTGGCGINKKNK